MVLHNADVTGSLTLNNVNISGVTGSFAASASFAAQINSLNSYTASNNVAISALNAFSGSILAYTSSANARFLSIETATGSLNTYTGSNNANIALISANIASLSAGSASSAVLVNTLSGSVASLNAYTASNNANIISLFAGSASAAVTVNSVSQSTVANTAAISILASVTGSYATTGSNVFVAPQFINQASNAISFTSTASLYTNGGARVSKDLFVSGTTYLNNLTVYGTSSIQYITSSQVNIGTNIITVNTDTPAVRFGGLAVFDSGSTGLTGSMLWDSEKNHWVYANPSGSSYSGGMIMSGPRSSALGSEQGTTNNALMKGQGGDHITSSAIIEDGTLTSMYSTMYVSSSGNVGIGTSTPTRLLELYGPSLSADTPTLRISSADSSGTRKFGIEFYSRTGADVRGKILADNGGKLYIDDNGGGGVLLQANGGTGNVGIGTIPSAWSLGKTLQIGGDNAAINFSGTAAILGIVNAYYNGSSYIIQNTGTQASFEYGLARSNAFNWRIGASASAGSTTPLGLVMSLSSNGNLSIGNTNDTYKLDVTGTARFTG